MIDHVLLGVHDVAASKRFYDVVLAPLGHAPLVVDGPPTPFVEWGDFAIAADGRPPTTSAHLAFVARSRVEVDAFHAAGIAAGYRDNGPPGERPQPHRGSYGAFLLDPDGNTVEAVFHDRS